VQDEPIELSSVPVQELAELEASPDQWPPDCISKPPPRGTEHPRSEDQLRIERTPIEARIASDVLNSPIGGEHATEPTGTL
jgi:hypothetical protein